jgi:molybdenum cofactor cytidylyltransferase
MGAPKQVLPLAGVPLVRLVAVRAIDAGCSPVVVVTGAHEHLVRSALDGLDIVIAVNAGWREGMGTSIQAGLRALEPDAVSGAVLLLADQALVEARRIKELVDTQRDSGALIVAASYAGTVGVPACFAARAFPLLEALGPSEGCKGIMLRHPDDVVRVSCPEASVDLDTPDDLDRVRRNEPALPNRLSQ